MHDHPSHGRPSVACNGRQIAFYRKRHGWTQVELAEKVGYCERLIRKAEAGGPVQWLVLDELAIALGGLDEPLTAEDLTCDPARLARLITTALATHRAEWVRHIDHVLAPNAVLQCAGDPAQIPFAGQWLGHSGFDNWARLFCSLLVAPVPDYYRPTVVTQGNEVIQWGEDWYQPPGIPSPPLQVAQRMLFGCGKLLRLEMLFDTQASAAALTQAAAAGAGSRRDDE